MAVYQSSLKVSSNSVVNRLRLLEEIASQELLDLTATNDGIGNLVKLVIISMYQRSLFNRDPNFCSHWNIKYGDENMMPKVQKKTLIILIFAMFFICSLSFADSQITLSKGQTIYIPVYSNVFSGDKALSFNLAAMLSIRNTDINNAMEINSVEYYDNEGILLKIYIEKTIVLGPLASKHIFIKESDEAGGFGANFIVRWEATKEINAPLVESVMIGARSGQGISFISEGQVITEKNK